MGLAVHNKFARQPVTRQKRLLLWEGISAYDEMTLGTFGVERRRSKSYEITKEHAHTRTIRVFEKRNNSLCYLSIVVCRSAFG